MTIESQRTAARARGASTDRMDATSTNRADVAQSAAPSLILHAT